MKLLFLVSRQNLLAGGAAINQLLSKYKKLGVPIPSGEVGSYSNSRLTKGQQGKYLGRTMLIKLLEEASNEKMYDTRVIERNRGKALFTQDQFTQYLDKLEDDSANADYQSIQAIQES